jgi:hypothetical protein
VREVLVSGAEAAFAQLRDVDGVFVDGHAVTAVDAGQRSSIMLATPDAVAQLRGLGFTVTETAENTQELAQLEALLTSNEAGLTGFS